MMQAPVSSCNPNPVYYIKCSRDPSRLSWVHQTDNTDRDQCTPLNTQFTLDVFLLFLLLGDEDCASNVLKSVLGNDLRSVDISAVIDYVECVDVDSTIIIIIIHFKYRCPKYSHKEYSKKHGRLVNSINHLQ